MTPYLFSFVFPFLLMMVCLQGIAALPGFKSKGPTPTFVLASVSALAVAIPVFGLPLGRWIISLNANFSILLLALVFNRIAGTAFHMRPLDPKALNACALFSLISGVILYPMALGLGPYDPYGAGWGFSWLFAGVLACTILLVIMKNRFGVVLFLAILAYDLGLLESSNFWDYLIDPFVVIWAAIRLAWPRLFNRIRFQGKGKKML
ncbi:MAG: hypothetical protein R6U38_11110 [Desulfatiglandaceae bacterium]